MANNIVAYVGVDSFDIILYLSMILERLNKRVLLVDHSETLSLKHTIPQPLGIACDEELVHYRRMEFTSKSLQEDEVNEFDNIFISCGFRITLSDLSLCNRFIYVTDPYRYNQERLALSGFNSFSQKQDKAILIKDVLDSYINPEEIAGRIDQDITINNITVLYRDDGDDRNRLLLHHNRIYRIPNISRQMRTYLTNEIRKLYPELTSQQITKAFHQARKGDERT